MKKKTIWGVLMLIIVSTITPIKATLSSKEFRALSKNEKQRFIAIKQDDAQRYKGMIKNHKKLLKILPNLQITDEKLKESLESTTKQIEKDTQRLMETESILELFQEEEY